LLRVSPQFARTLKMVFSTKTQWTQKT
jgi:hypothetical protein